MDERVKENELHWKGIQHKMMRYFLFTFDSYSFLFQYKKLAWDFNYKQKDFKYVKALINCDIHVNL